MAKFQQNMAKFQHNDEIDQAEINSIRFTWTIKKFSLYATKEVGYFQDSPKFSYETVSGGITWYLRAYPNGREKQCENHVSLYLHLAYCATRVQPVTFQFSILNIMGEKIHKEELTYIFRNHGHGLTKFIETTTILDITKGLLANGALTICCDIQHATKITQDTIFNKAPDCRLRDDFSSLFEKELFSDVTLSAQGEEFKVHKSILAARSSVFAALFLNDMNEENQDVIEIVDVSKNVLRAMLSFIYSGKVSDDKSLLFTSDLLIAANKYNLERLTVTCEKALCMKLTADNACDLVILADLHNASELKATAMNFINNEICAVLTTETRKSLSQDHPCLLSEILDYHRASSKGGTEPNRIETKQIVPPFRFSSILLTSPFPHFELPRCLRQVGFDHKKDGEKVGEVDDISSDDIDDVDEEL